MTSSAASGRRRTAPAALRRPPPGGRSRHALATGLGAISRRRLSAGFLLAGTLLPLLTAVLSVVRPQMAPVDDLLLYLVAVVAVTLVGGLWRAVLAAVTACLLLN